MNQCEQEQCEDQDSNGKTRRNRPAKPTFAERLQAKIDGANREIKRLQRVRNAAHKFLMKLESDPELVQIIHEDRDAAEHNRDFDD